MGIDAHARVLVAELFCCSLEVTRFAKTAYVAVVVGAAADEGHDVIGHGGDRVESLCSAVPAKWFRFQPPLALGYSFAPTKALACG